MLDSKTIRLMYRGQLSSCNYDCQYCPFAKHWESKDELAKDKADLLRFEAWLAQSDDQSLEVFFTPWGEALVRHWYRDAFTRISQLPQIKKVVAQTNISYKFDWLEACDKDKVALWTTYHPTEITREKFLAKCLELRERNVRFSVGTVGIRDGFDDIHWLRDHLPDDVYLWVNAFKDDGNKYYSDAELTKLKAADPLFGINLENYPSLGKACQAGESIVTIDGDGDIRRCHFIDDVIGNIYSDEGLTPALQRRPCPNKICDCHIGYVHLDELKLYDTFADGVLERIPVQVAAEC